MTKWNCNNIVDFLKIYEQYPLLWNIKHKDYLNIKLKDEIFKKLYADLENEGLIMGIDEKQLKAKIKNLKDVYRNELAKIEKVEKVEVEQMKYILQNLRGSTLPTFFVKFYQQDTAIQICATSASTVENDDRTTEENKNRIAVDSSESSLSSKEKIELNICQPLNTEINLNKKLDIGDFLNSNLHINNIFKKQLLEDHWRPLNKNNFPFSTHKKCGSIEKRYVKLEHLEKYFWLDQKIQCLLGISIGINKPRLSEVMKNRENPQTQSVEEYFRITLFIPFLDNLLYDLESRFDEDLMSVFDLDVVLPNIVKTKSIFDDKLKLENKIKNVINQFGDLVACEINIPRDIFESSIIGEFELWHNYWLQEEQLPSSPLEAIKQCDPDLFSGINVLLKILITLPATGATAERFYLLSLENSKLVAHLLQHEWLYVTNKDSLFITCDEDKESKNHVLEGSGIISLNETCKGYANRDVLITGRLTEKTQYTDFIPTSVIRNLWEETSNNKFTKTMQSHHVRTNQMHDLNEITYTRDQITDQNQHHEQIDQLETKVYIYFIFGGVSIIIVIVINILIIWFINYETTKTPLAKPCACSFLMEDKWTQTMSPEPTVEATTPAMEFVTSSVNTTETVPEKGSVVSNLIYPKLKY
ncbi:hypothetical protein QTP88_000996 [Uroleucon formosanum]